MLLMIVIGEPSLIGGKKEKIYSVVVGVFIYLCLENGLTVLGTSPEIIGLIEGPIFLASVTLTLTVMGFPIFYKIQKQYEWRKESEKFFKFFTPKFVSMLHPQT